MFIRKALKDETTSIMQIYDKARTFMRENGNMNQWTNGYPSRSIIESDIENGNLHVVLDEGELVGVFGFSIGDDPTYNAIEGGSWHYSDGYGVIHRIASNGKAKGVAKAAFDHCLGKIGHLRIDTHEDNIPMQNALEGYGFRKCGTIHIADGSPRIAYDIEV